MADSETVDTTQQVTSKRVAAGKAIAQRTKLAHEAQEKALIQAISRGFALRRGSLLAAKHDDFSEPRHPSRDSDEVSKC